MSSAWELYLTPSLTLSLLLEAESPLPSLARWLSQLALYFRPALLRQALAYEQEQRPEGEVVGAGTLRVVDYAVWRLAQQSQPTPAPSSPVTAAAAAYRPLSSIPPEDLPAALALAEGIEVPSVEHDLLSVALSRVLSTYALVEAVEARADRPVQQEDDGATEAQLREVWALLRPEKRDLGRLEGKHWQEIGFQNVSPSTDFRRVGMLGLDSLLFFARTYGSRAAEIVDEAVGGGEHWYPLALASIHMTAFALDLALNRDLQMFLLRAVQTAPDSAPSPSPSSSSSSAPSPDLTPFLRLSSDLLLLFHAHWQQGGYTVMQFEQVSGEFQRALRPWIRRGVLDGRALGWERWDEGGVKLD